MTLHRAPRFLPAVVLLALVSAPSRSETYWSAEGAGLSAFHLDPATSGLTMTMQMAGGSLSPFPYLGVAVEPSTGDLWATYYDSTQFREAFGRLRPGALQPEEAFVLADRYQFLNPHPTFSSDGSLYLQLHDIFESRTILAKVDTASSIVEPVFEILEGSLYGIVFDPTSGKLYLSGLESCASTCLPFLDTLTTPQHQRERLLSGEIPTGELMFTAGGDLLLMSYFTYRLQNGSFESFGAPPYFRSPFGSLFHRLDHASRADETSSGCIPSLTRACLQYRRFSLDVTFDASEHGGPVGDARPQLESDESIKFYFFTSENLEVFVKILDGCGYNGRYWIFASGLTDLGVSLRVTDTRTGAVYTHDNPRGQVFVPLLDIEAFPCVQN